MYLISFLVYIHLNVDDGIHSELINCSENEFLIILLILLYRGRNLAVLVRKHGDVQI